MGSFSAAGRALRLAVYTRVSAGMMASLLYTADGGIPAGNSELSSERNVRVLTENAGKLLTIGTS